MKFIVGGRYQIYHTSYKNTVDVVITKANHDRLHFNIVEGNEIQSKNDFSMKQVSNFIEKYEWWRVTPDPRNTVKLDEDLFEL